MKLVTQIAVLVGVAALIGGGVTMLNGPSPTGAAPKVGGASKPVPVVVTALTLAEDRRIVEAVGTAKAERSVTIYPSVGGEVTEVAFAAGEPVAAGDVLVRLDAEAERLAVRYADLEREDLQRRVKRLETLAKSGSATEVALDEARTALKLAQVQSDQARVDLEDRLVRAPFDGVPGISNVDPGDRVSADTAITTLDDRRTLLIDFLVPEGVSARLSVGQPVPVRAWALGENDIEGTLIALGSRIDPATRMLQARARIPNPDEALRPGTSFAVTLAVPGDDYPVVPEVAVLWSRDGSHVWRVAEGEGGGLTAERIFVDVVRREKGRALIDGPLAAGDRIVVEGLQSMRPGRAVEIAGGADAGAGE
jgi:membrane fusion protein (multidrug efflux system)